MWNIFKTFININRSHGHCLGKEKSTKSQEFDLIVKYGKSVFAKECTLKNILGHNRI